MLSFSWMTCGVYDEFNIVLNFMVYSHGFLQYLTTQKAKLANAVHVKLSCHNVTKHRQQMSYLPE